MFLVICGFGLDLWCFLVVVGGFGWCFKFMGFSLGFLRFWWIGILRMIGERWKLF